MAVSGGPHIDDDGLVLYVDLNNSKSYPGEPTTNIVTNTNLDTGWSKGYCTDILWNDFPSPDGINSQVVSFIDIDSYTGTASSAYWYCYGNYAPQVPETTYTISIYARTIGGNGIYISAYTADNSETGRQWTNYVNVPGDGNWHRIIFNSIYNPSGSQSDSLSFYWYGMQNFQRMWLCAPQMEAKSHATPFVVGTRIDDECKNLADVNNGVFNLTPAAYDSNGMILFNDGVVGNVAENDYYLINLSTNINAYQISFWAKSQYSYSSAYNNNYPTLFDFRRSDDGNVGYIQAGPWTGGATNESFHIWGDGSSMTYIRDTISADWHYFTWNWNGSLYDFYLDGKKKTTYNGTNGDGLGVNNILSNINYIRVGYNAGTYSFRGYMPIIQIYNKQKTEQSIIDNFNKTRKRFGV